MTTIPAATRWAATPEVLPLERASVSLIDRDRTRPFLLLHGGAGPGSVAGFGDLLAARTHSRVLIPTHPGFAGTERPDDLAGIPALAQLYADLLDRLDVWDVTVVGNSIGGWIAAELALLGSPRVSGAVLVNAVGLEVPEHPITDVAGLAPDELAALSFKEPARFPVRQKPDFAALAAYTRMTMSDPGLRERLTQLDLPVKVIWGAADGIALAAYGRAYADAIPGATFTLIDGAGHLPQLEAPEELLAAIGAER
ncbi:alpha/beta fold hydrolase [Actinoplanes sp. NPDC049265]|uniref:alpha/beta fold hydrolase n=1 Tax=Actinoplanes sp. NPDC049265 TaxID=3363902 RepID=UPI0037219E94